MTVYKLAAALMVAASLIAAPPAGRAEPPPPTVVTSAPTDSTRAQLAVMTAQVREAYANAWAQRQAGDIETARGVAEHALETVAQALELDPDMATRRDLNDLKSRLGGLRDAIDHDRESAARAKASGNEADDKVLNTPAKENIDIQMNADVARWVEFFTGAGRSTFERWLKRSGRYVPLFRSVLEREGLPSDLVHLVYVESGFNISARSSSAAVGPWQFLRGTARLFGLTVDQWVDERKDPEKSTVAAARYLKHLHAIFGDWPLALASYNAGEGTVLRAIKKQGTNNYWDLRLPRQTEDYVPQFMAVLAISRDPGKYGFDSVELDDPMAFDEVALKGAVDLRSLARLADCSVEELRLLNPAVLRHAATGRDGVTTLRVPPGKGEILSRNLSGGATLPAVNLTLKHRVRRGETLQRIANQYHVSAKQLALSNGIGKKRPLKRGMMLTVPASLKSPAPAILEAGDPRASTAYVPTRRRAVPTSMGAKSAAEGRMTITVKKGETLAAIAARHGVSADDIMRWNRLKTSKVKRGMRLKIRTGPVAESVESHEPLAKAVSRPAGRDSVGPVITVEPMPRRYASRARMSSHGPAVAKARTSPARRSARTVQVRRGDTLTELAQRHGVTVDALRRANRLGTRPIRTGERLKIPTS